MGTQRSLFDQTLDRSVFVTYFLGGVVPLLGLAFLAERILPELEDASEQRGLIALVIAIGFLSLVAFVALRRIVLRTITQMNADNERLESLLGFARELANAPHSQVVAETTVFWTQRIGAAEACWLLTRSDLEKPFEVMAQRGDDASRWLEDHRDQWLELVERATRDAETTIVRDREPGALSLVVAPLSGESLPDGAVLAARRGQAFSPIEADALGTLAAQSGVALTNADRGDVQRNFFSHMTELVLAALDTHIKYRTGHATRVAETANRVARAMGVDEDALQDLHFAALLHDVGMLRIPVENQRDPKHFRKHSLVGYKMLSRIRAWRNAAPIVLQHHERPDGTGYPDGAQGDDIVLGARILAACDAWDAMRTTDWNREAMSPAEALAELEANAGTQFDADVVATFRALVEQNRLGD